MLRLARRNKVSAWYSFEEQAKLHKDKPCIWFRPRPSDVATRYTWTETYDNSNRYAQFLLENGVKLGDLVGTCLQNSPEFMFNMIGCWSIGCAPALINTHLGGAALLNCLKVAESKILIVDEDFDCQKRIEEVRSQIEELGMKIVILNTGTKDRILSLEARRPEDVFRNGITGGFPVFLFYTSGTTGFPKACAFPTVASYMQGLSKQRTTGLKPGDVWYDCMPLYHGTGCVIAVSCITSGIELAIGKRFSVSNFWRDIHDSNANAFVYVGETARYLLAAPPSPLDKTHKLKAMHGNGKAGLIPSVNRFTHMTIGMRPDVFSKFTERFNIPVVNEFFNSTEGMLMMLNVCRGPFHVGHVGHHGAIQRWQLKNKIIPVAIDHESGDKLWRDPKTGFARRNKYEEGGEIIIACQSEKDFVGYWNNPDATSKRFERDVFVKGDLYYRTGDALRRDQDGRWYFLDRLGDTFRWKSENVSTAEVAEVLGRFPGLVEANVYGVEIPGHDGRAGCAAIFIRPNERASFDYAGLLKHARKGLPRYAVPLFLRLVQTSTPMHNNKQNKVGLRGEGVDLKKIANGKAGKDDVVLWLAPGTDTYQPFSEKDWNEIVGGKVRL